MEHGLYKHKFYGELRIPMIDEDNLGKSEVIEDLPMDTYQADMAHVSNSGIKQVLISPDNFLAWVSERGEDDDDEEEDHFRFGRAVHMSILEPKLFESMYVVEPVFEGLTKDGKMSTRSGEAQEKKKAWYQELPEGALVITEAEMDMLTMMIQQLVNHPQANELLKNGKPEVTLLWTDPITKIRCRARPDYISRDPNGNIYVMDVKSTKARTKDEFKREIERLNYNMQLAFYSDGIKETFKQEPEAAAFIALSKVFPHHCFVYWQGEHMNYTGRNLYRHGLKALRRSIITNDWPTPQVQAEMIDHTNEQYMPILPQYPWTKEYQELTNE